MAQIPMGEALLPRSTSPALRPTLAGSFRKVAAILPRDEEMRLLEGARRGEEAAFAELVRRHTGAMLRFARLYVGDAALAEDVVQDAWMGFLRGMDRFEARSALRTWLFRIVLNRLRTRVRQERRLIPFSTLFDAASSLPEPAVQPERFLGADHADWPHHWRSAPESWGESPEARLLADETRSLIDRAVAALPPAQREVITLRDIEGWSSAEVCNVLGISQSNQRVLLHRARSKVRCALELYLTQG